MSEELEVRYLVESVEGTYCVYGYSVHDNVLSLTEGDGVIKDIPLEDIISIVRESVTREDITASIKDVALV